MLISPEYCDKIVLGKLYVAKHNILRVYVNKFCFETHHGYVNKFCTIHTNSVLLFADVDIDSDFTWVKVIVGEKILYLVFNAYLWEDKFCHFLEIL